MEVSGDAPVFADVSSDGPVVLWVVEHGLEIKAKPSSVLEGHHFRATLPPGWRESASWTWGPNDLAIADVLIHSGGGDDLERCLTLLRTFPGCGLVASGGVGQCLVLGPCAQPLLVEVDLPAAVVASAVMGWTMSWLWWFRRSRPLSGLLARSVSIDYAGRRHPATITLAPSL
ncbi:hypothetical protein ACG83_40665 [Frankia sp. R43]|uniref:hypothetical protein n=1 Tax=Parafrankia TaxID=2994362 RepID=UPI0006DA8C5D|nr:MULTISPECIES: hypothetical protein [Parafrankia]KPM50341.1 hypothetical protein ACG83_40665 [Frankia sp. R43]MBE3204747.1 hypothetical protein [Parafrankia sp. CH37]